MKPVTEIWKKLIPIIDVKFYISKNPKTLFHIFFKNLFSIYIDIISKSSPSFKFVPW